MILSVNGISFDYKSRKTLDGIDFKVDTNEIVSILGPNGAGKTTLLKCINRILKPYKGAIYIDGKNLQGLSQNRIAQNMSYVAQKTDTNKLSVFDSILLGRKPHIGFNISENDLKLVHSMIKTLDLEKIALSYTNEISGGELQKVSIARALVQEPKIILMDEPTASLDLKNQCDILTLITDVAKVHGIAVIMTVHDINIALRYSDRIIFLKNGVIHTQIKPSDITPDIIEEVYEVKVDIREFDNFRHIFPV